MRAVWSVPSSEVLHGLETQVLAKNHRRGEFAWQLTRAKDRGVCFDCGQQTEPVLISACLLGIPCRWHGRRAKKREKLIASLKRKYVLVPICPEQLGGMPTPRTGEMLHGTGAQVLDEGLRLIAPETGEDVTEFHVHGRTARAGNRPNRWRSTCLSQGRQSLLRSGRRCWRGSQARRHQGDSCWMKFREWHKKKS